MTKFGWPFKRGTSYSKYSKCTNTKYNKSTCECDLFVDYISAVLNPKSEVSGYPGWVRSPEEEERYIENFYAREGVTLDRDEINKTRLNDVGQNYVGIRFELSLQSVEIEHRPS